MPAINPIVLKGPWRKGYALDRHVVQSIYLGPDSAGRDRFDTTRSAVGELLYRLKYQGDQTAAPELVAALSRFLRDDWKIAAAIEAILPAPPCNCRC
ncbi:MAG: hypothetical protein IT317_22785 [Anaerolineales bacterium]|nr:hypothetical protein [Anaerolineales bacterium]